MAAGGAAAEEAQAALFDHGIADDAEERLVGGAAGGPVVGTGGTGAQDEIGVVDAGAVGDGGGVVAPVALAGQRRTGPRPETGCDDLQPGGEHLVPHRQQLARGLAQGWFFNDTATT